MQAQHPGLRRYGKAAIDEAAASIRAGGIVAVPTETVYGLAADATSAAAVARIYAAKGRPSFNPLIVHVLDRAAAERIAVFDADARMLADAFWPGPLTLVLPLRTDAGIASLVTAGLDTIALRVPAHRAMRALLAASGVPLAAPSANASGAISPTRAVHVVASLGKRARLIIDDGACAAGVESTIVAGRNVLRPGPITADMIAQSLPTPSPAHPELVEACPERLPQAGSRRVLSFYCEEKDKASTGSARTEVGLAKARVINAPGQLDSHYAPSKPLRLNATDADPDEWHIGFGPIAGDTPLSATGDPIEAAANLFDALHRADASSRAKIAVAPIPETGIGAAINDRLRRAAHR